MSFCVVAHGVKAVRIVGDGVAAVVRPDAVRVWLLMVRSCSDRGQGCAHLPRLKQSARVGLCASLHHTYIYIIGKTNYFNAKTKNYLFLFGCIKISLYICTRKQEPINNNSKNTRL